MCDENKKSPAPRKETFSEERGLNIPTQISVPPMPPVKPLPVVQENQDKK